MQTGNNIHCGSCCLLKHDAFSLIWGQGGAAEMLGIPPTTLQSKVKKLGIKKEFS